MLKEGGTLLVLYMAWLPYEDEIAGASEKLVLKIQSGWSGRPGEKSTLSLCPTASMTRLSPYTTRGVQGSPCPLQGDLEREDEGLPGCGRVPVPGELQPGAGHRLMLESSRPRRIPH